jgi:predicted DNA-binding transcriptional regulator AlpA
MSTSEIPKRRGRKLLRLPEARKRLAVGKTKFDEDFIKTGRLRLVRIGPKCVAVVEDELDALIDEIVAERDASPSPATYDLSDRDYASGQFKARSDRAAKSKELRA